MKILFLLIFFSISSQADTLTPSNFLGDCSVYLTSGNGYGSTNTKIRRYTTSSTSGSCMTYADSATAGMSITINVAGIYCIQRHDFSSSVNADNGLSLNSSQLTTNIQSITAADRIAITENSGAAGSTSMTYVGRCRYFSVNDVIRAHDAVANVDTAQAYVWLNIIRVN